MKKLKTECKKKLCKQERHDKSYIRLANVKNC